MNAAVPELLEAFQHLKFATSLNTDPELQAEFDSLVEDAGELLSELKGE